ncbi:uncharacterized protein LOC130524063 isoform X6 [Takifugu flavidus]|uniref:uncharacterized protein LOC130524063 isoform X6 n=1 Tax=Takifugu flavidus TaxID=433684 RepID=UPI0025447971|nr:uncharacterized protein LOC130524063 isoform X6 [Takifugu flavidus]
MAGRSLSAVLLYLLYSPTLALLPPELVITEHLITETDSVTLHCRTPSDQTVHQCFVYSVETKNRVSFSCMKTLTATELLIHSKQSAPAVVQVRCFYTVKFGDIKSPSPHSGTSFITIQTGWTLTNTDGVFTSTLNPGGAASGGSDEKNKDKGMWILKLIIAVACFGVIVGVILLGLMLWRTESERRKRQKDETEGEYHMYCTVTDDLTPPAKTDIVYSKVERH